MNDIDLSKYSKSALIGLISQIAEELSRRESAPTFVESESVTHAPLSAPSQSELVFIKNCLRSGSYVHADMKDRYRDLAKKYSQWFESQLYPTDLRGSSLKKWRQYFSVND